MFTTVITGVLTAAIVELLKRLKNVPLNPEDTGKIRIVAGVLSVLGTIGAHWATGGDFNDGFVNIAAESLVTFLMATLSYFSFLRK